jgi:hypothetical protein
MAPFRNCKEAVVEYAQVKRACDFERGEDAFHTRFVYNNGEQDRAAR